MAEPRRQLLISPLLRQNKTLFIFGVTILAYAMGLIYETCTLALYGIGGDVLELSPYVLFNGLIGIVIVYLVLELWIEIYFQIVSFRKAFAKQYFLRHSFIMLEALFLMLSIFGIILVQLMIHAHGFEMQAFKQTIIIFLVNSIGVTLLFFLLPFVINMFKREKKVALDEVLQGYYLKRDEEAEKLEERKSKRNKNLPSFSKSTIATIIFVLIYIFSVTTTIATFNARSSKDYYVLKTNGDIKTLIVKHYTGTILTKDYNIKTNKFQDGFGVIKLEGSLELKDHYRVPAWGNAS